MIEKLLKSGRYKEALALLENNRATISEQKYQFFRGIIAFNDGDPTIAESYLTAAHSHGFKPEIADALRLVFQSSGRHVKALSLAESVYLHRGKQRKDLMPYLTCLLDSGKVDIAESVVDEVVLKEGFDSKLAQAKASCLRQRGLREEAISLVKNQLAIHKDDPALLRILADIVGELSSEEAIEIYDQALKLTGSANPRSLHPMKWNMSLHLLRLRQFDRGWEYYESGLTAEVGTMGRNLHPLVRKLPYIDESRMNTNRWTVLTVEQGIGDQVFFLSVMEEAIAEFRKIILLCEPRLMDLYARSFPAVQVLAPGVVESLSDSQIPNNGLLPIGSLMRRYRPTIESFLTHRRPFLKVSRPKFERYRSLLKEVADGRPIVGISWKGGYWENQQRNKTIGLKEWGPLLSRNALFVNLQYGDVASDLVEVAQSGVEVYQFPKIDFKAQIDEWLAIASACDGIVSVSTALVHFAGACNQKVALLMPERQGPYIWGTEDLRSISYPNVFIFRKKSGESYESLMRRISEQIL